MVAALAAGVWPVHAQEIDLSGRDLHACLLDNDSYYLPARFEWAVWHSLPASGSSRPCGAISFLRTF
jgi:hypothetical protein